MPIEQKASYRTSTVKIDNLRSSQNRREVLLPIFFAWLVSLVAALGSLFVSEVMRLPPCILCWYQRIGMYPLVPLLTIALLRKDTKVGRYAWPFVVFGLGMAVYHNLLYYHVIPESISPCT